MRVHAAFLRWGIVYPKQQFAQHGLGGDIFPACMFIMLQLKFQPIGQERPIGAQTVLRFRPTRHLHLDRGGKTKLIFPARFAQIARLIDVVLLYLVGVFLVNCGKYAGRATSRACVVFVGVMLAEPRCDQFLALLGPQAGIGRRDITDRLDLVLLHRCHTSFIPSARPTSALVASGPYSPCPPLRFCPNSDNSSPRRRRQPKRASSAV